MKTYRQIAQPIILLHSGLGAPVPTQLVNPVAVTKGGVEVIFESEKGKG